MREGESVMSELCEGEFVLSEGESEMSESELCEGEYVMSEGDCVTREDELSEGGSLFVSKRSLLVPILRESLEKIESKEMESAVILIVQAQHLLRQFA